MPLLQHIHRVMGQIAGSTWPKKVSNLLAGLIILFSSTQLELHFWPDSAFVYGARIDYLSPTLYLVDLLIITYLIARRSDLVGSPTRSDLKGLLFSILLVNILFSQNPWASLSWSLHLILYLLFILSISHHRLSTISHALTLTLLFQLFLSFAQVSLGHSVQGLIYYLGERMISVGLPNVAVGSFMGQVVLRAYGTFSHPNILAGYSVVATLIIYRLTKSRVTVSLVTTITSLIILLSQSRASVLAFFGLVIPLILLKSLRSRLVYFVFLLCATSYMLYASVFARPLDLSLSERLSLQQVSLKVIRAYPLFGAGANAAVTRYPDLAPNFRLLQPDHNSVTLFLSWFGIIGLLFASYFLFLICFKFRISNFGFIVPLFPLLLLDHYLLTSPQGLFILLLYLKVLKIAKLRVL